MAGTVMNVIPNPVFISEFMLCDNETEHYTHPPYTRTNTYILSRPNT